MILDANACLILLACSGALTGFFAFLYFSRRLPYLRVWVWAWGFVTAHFLSALFHGGEAPWRWEAALNQWLMAIAALLFLAAAQVYSQSRTQWVRPVVLASLVFAAWGMLRYSGHLAVPLQFGTAFVLFAVARLFWQEARKQQSPVDRLLCGAFVLWACTLLRTVFQIKQFGFAGQGLQLFVLLPEVLTAVLMVMAFYEEEKRRLERNMLALSNLNLATSSILSGELQKMLAPALERVLGVVRVPSGALLLQYGEPEAPACVVTTGMSGEFFAKVKEESLGSYLVNLVARMGGLVVLRELRDASWGTLEREPLFRRIRELVVGEGLRTAVGISLQAKERVFGVLLLGCSDSRRFTAAELRLLLGLSHQIGVAVENSYLIQQTSQRSQDLHVLNEIGRTLSSTLDLDALFQTVSQEVRRLFAVSNFYIALDDREHEQIRFELEVVENARQEKRARPAGNHLSEYVIRTSQPLLIRERLEDEVRRLRVIPERHAGSFCGVPLVLYDRAIGLMAMYSLDEHAFDESHLDLLSVLASEAAIAIENARLFGEQQEKTRHLTLLNSLSRHAITTPDPEEMLQYIAAELGKSLSYDHVGIAVVDAEAGDVVVQAEAGLRRGALGLRVPVGQGLVGQVARSGQTRIVAAGGEAGLSLTLPDSTSGIALPVAYAEQLLGVLYVETIEAREFAESEQLLLETIADLFACALHNARTLQRAQEQAITDDLTGVKTHRYLMEAFSSECKRSARANRSFAVAMMDLDHFKFVNDFYGHLEGDSLLRRIGQLLEQHCRRSDVVARYGGDEFVILMPETDMEQASQHTQKLRSRVASDLLLHEKNVTVSFGIAAFPAHGSTPEQLLQLADASMYLSKHRGGNAITTAEQFGVGETQRWKRNVLEAYLSVTLKRMFSTGPEVFEEICRRFEQFARSPVGQEEPFVAGEPLPVLIDSLISLALALDARDQNTRGHSQKVSAYAVMVAQALKFSPREVEEIRVAGLLHDAGKVGIPETIVNKAGPLDPDEWESMRLHPTLGARLLDPLSGVRHIQEMIRQHHEFLDGTGYPASLRGEQILRGARLLAIADTYDTITCNRSYRKARTPEEAFAELERCAGTHFDLELVRVFIETVRQQPRPFIEISVP